VDFSNFQEAVVITFKDIVPWILAFTLAGAWILAVLVSIGAAVKRIW
jgi:hypothetical protein